MTQAMSRCTTVRSGYRIFSRATAPVFTLAPDTAMKRSHMKSFVLRSLFLLPLLIYAEACSVTDKSQSMTDPLMGLSYNPDSVHFELCPPWFDSREGHVPGKEWIFAKCPLQDST